MKRLLLMVCVAFIVLSVFSSVFVNSISASPICGNNICEEGEANDPGGCGPNADSRCLGPPARQGTCPQDCQNDCKTLFWFDDGDKSCGQKEFCTCPTCGDYMYPGLQTFESEVQCEKVLNTVENKTFHLSNGRNAEIKIMPETASERAVERLGELNFTIQLKEVGNDKVAYELTGNKEGRFLGIFKIIARVQAQIDAETGDVKIIKPWLAFLASGI